MVKLTLISNNDDFDDSYTEFRENFYENINKILIYLINDDFYHLFTNYISKNQFRLNLQNFVIIWFTVCRSSSNFTMIIYMLIKCEIVEEQWVNPRKVEITLHSPHRDGSVCTAPLPKGSGSRLNWPTVKSTQNSKQ